VPPPPIAEFMAARGYLPIGVPMLKRVLALPGRTVCRQGFDIIVYGAAVGRVRERDSASAAKCRRGRAAEPSATTNSLS
jgi:type IV secretory pathway protease TraF